LMARLINTPREIVSAAGLRRHIPA